MSFCPQKHVFIFAQAAPKLILVATLAVTSGCSAAKNQCKEWRDQGLIYSTLESCSACYEQYGSPQPDVVAGCALGLDAAQLIQQSNR
jgi:hypothetical protein